MTETTSVLREETTTPAPGAGDIVCCKYRLLRPLGEGGMGVVFEAEHLRLRQSVAIKFLRSDVLVLPEAIERFEREARASARLRGPHVVHVLDVDTDDHGRPYMVMELLRGRDLEAELKARGPLAVEAAVDLVLQACVAVAEAHAAGVVHRDLKPSNLFLSEEGGKRVLKVLDFGISKTAPDADATVTSMCMTVGTPLYMSPEQMRSSRDVDGRTDIWSLGVILYELVAGTPPFLGTTTAAIAAIVADAMPSLRRVRPDVPEALERVLVTALAKAPADRLPTAEALAAALMPFASAEGVAGPFSLRPSERDFALASSAMARTPSSPRVRDSTELLALPARREEPAAPQAPLVQLDSNGSTVPVTATASPPSARPPRTRPSREALRTFAGTLVLGMGLATVMTLLFPQPGAAGSVHADHATAVAPAPAHSHAPAPVPSRVPLPPARIVADADPAASGPEILAIPDRSDAAVAELVARPRALARPASPRPPPRRVSMPPNAPAASDRPHMSAAPSPYL